MAQQVASALVSMPINAKSSFFFMPPLLYKQQLIFDQAQPGYLFAIAKYIVSNVEVDFLSTLTSGVPSR